MFLHLEDCQFLLSFHPLSCLQVIMHSLKEKGECRRGCPCLEERGVFFREESWVTKNRRGRVKKEERGGVALSCACGQLKS